jgi:hypothetical protein
LNAQAKKNGTVPDLRRRLEISLIPFADQAGESDWPSRFEIPVFEQFLAARATILHKKIGELIGQSLVDKEASDGDEDPDGVDEAW